MVSVPGVRLGARHAPLTEGKFNYRSDVGEKCKGFIFFFQNNSRPQQPAQALKVCAELVVMLDLLPPKWMLTDTNFTYFTSELYILPRFEKIPRKQSSSLKTLNNLLDFITASLPLF